MNVLNSPRGSSKHHTGLHRTTPDPKISEDSFLKCLKNTGHADTLLHKGMHYAPIFRTYFIASYIP